MMNSNSISDVNVLISSEPVPVIEQEQSLENLIIPSPIIAEFHETSHSPKESISKPILPKQTEHELKIDSLVNAIEQRIRNGVKEYHFRPVSIDGIYCYFVLYHQYNILTVESINVKYRFHYNGCDTLVPYVLYHYNYTSIKKAVKHIEKIHSSYKQINGDFLSPENYNDLKLEEIVIPYSTNEICCVCFENTMDTTSCGHHICFVCRDKCCIQKKLNCPICREPDALSIYNNSMHLINNIDYAELFSIFKNKFLKQNPSNWERVREHDTESDYDSESESETEEYESELNPSEEVDSIS